MQEQRRKIVNKARRTHRTRSNIHGTAERPRLSVFISNRHVSAQLIDDDTHNTLAAVTTATGKTTSDSLTTQATTIGEAIAAQAKTKKITKVVLDRGGKLYHGRVKALAEAARAKGLEF